MPAQAGIQALEWMDTGFRRYDGSFMPIRRLDRNGASIFLRRHESARSSEIHSKNLRAFLVKVGELGLNRLWDWDIRYC